jgi:hypothetical protein
LALLDIETFFDNEFERILIAWDDTSNQVIYEAKNNWIKDDFAKRDAGNTGSQTTFLFELRIILSVGRQVVDWIYFRVTFDAQLTNKFAFYSILVQKIV